MAKHNARFNYLEKDYNIVFQSSINDDEYYGLGNFGKKKLKIIQAKYGCRHCFHTLPDKVTLDLHRFTWNNENSCFEIDTQKVRVRLNTLEEAIVEYDPEKDEIE